MNLWERKNQDVYFAPGYYEKDDQRGRKFSKYFGWRFAEDLGKSKLYTDSTSTNICGHLAITSICEHPVSGISPLFVILLRL